MARESALWQRVKAAGQSLGRTGHYVHLERIENDAGSGHPDVDGCIDGALFKIELKSGERPTRVTSKLKIHSNPHTKAAQDIWHTKRHRAGSRHHWILVQASGGAKVTPGLYLIPGQFYKDIYAPEMDLWMMSKCEPTDSVETVLLRACQGY